MEEIDIKNIVRRSIQKLGETDWYSALHFYRFCYIVAKISALSSPGSRGLEAGCWPGYLGLALQLAGYHVTGIDLRQKNTSRLNFDIVKLDINVDPLTMADNHFDFVTFSEVLEHLEEKSVSKVLAEIKRVLKPSGVFLMTTPNRLRPGRRFGKDEDSPDGFGHGHVREYNLSELKKMAAHAGFELVEANTISFYSGVGKRGEKTYFYPLIQFLKYDNRVRNFTKLLANPFLKGVPQWRDSACLILRK